MYGVYTFLERLGCRWFTPDVSRIPKLRTIEIPALDERQKPAFEYREVYIREAFDKDWAARNKTNGNFTALDASTGGKVEYFPFVHSFYSLVPPQKYFASHPEYFALVDGARRGAQAQLCLTNPEVLQLAVARVREWIRDHPERRHHLRFPERLFRLVRVRPLPPRRGGRGRPALRSDSAVRQRPGGRNREDQSATS